MKGLTLGRHEPEKVPMRLEMLRRVETVCGVSDESISRSDTRFLASLMTDRSTPLPVDAPWKHPHRDPHQGAASGPNQQSLLY